MLNVKISAQAHLSDVRGQSGSVVRTACSSGFVSSDAMKYELTQERVRCSA